MSFAQLTTLVPVPTAQGFISYRASEGLMSLLRANGIVPISGQRIYKAGEKIYFKNKGNCVISFLPDGRIHVLNAPTSYWSLYDNLSPHELRVLIAYCWMDENEQQNMQNALAPYSDSVTDVFRFLPKIKADWKNHFLEAYNSVEVA